VWDVGFIGDAGCRMQDAGRDAAVLKDCQEQRQLAEKVFGGGQEKSGGAEGVWHVGHDGV